VNVVPRDPRWQAFPHTKIAAENSGRHDRILSYEKLVAGAGFEPAVPQARDYEQNRDKPIIL
jgi:hypothetical protein